MTRLPAVLSGDDLPLAELHAARLDGELFRVDDCFSPIDEIAQPAHRARALATGLRDRLIAEQRSAAWIWGALETPPAVHQFCVVVGARVTPPGISWMTVREVVLDPSETVTLGGLQVTTPLRTAVDLARFTPDFSQPEVTMVTGLMRLGGFGLTECLDDMDRRRNLPNKRRAARFLRECVA
ncbi:MAG: hypothetical protein EPN91_04690 [Salinibacterium sp.]|nr:MAG: hypothetical protein EPN91_04690 [Salinibacterium sp.]